MVWSNEDMCKIAAKELKDGYYVNLGIGMPTQVANYVSEDIDVILHSENGMLGIGPFPKSEEEVDPDLINAGKQTVTELPYTTYFDSSMSFSMMRGGHIDLAILGGLQVAENGDLANWMIPGKMIKGMGGAMDLVSGVKKIVVLMKHCAKDGSFKVVRRCTLPITGIAVVDVLITDLCIFEFRNNKMYLVDKASDVTFDDIKRNTEAEFIIECK